MTIDSVIDAYPTGQGYAKWVSREHVKSVTARWKPKRGTETVREGFANIDEARFWIWEMAQQEVQRREARHAARPTP